MLKLTSIMVGTTRPAVLADFYEKVLDQAPGMAETENGFYGWNLEGAYFGVMNHSEMDGMTRDPGRVLFNFETSEVKAEFERIKGLGATVVQEPYEIGGMGVATFADPDGNYFQLITPVST